MHVEILPCTGIRSTLCILICSVYMHLTIILWCACLSRINYILTLCNHIFNSNCESTNTENLPYVLLSRGICLCKQLFHFLYFAVYEFSSMNIVSSVQFSISRRFSSSVHGSRSFQGSRTLSYSNIHTA